MTSRQTWIFQANPARFDIDAFLGTNPVEMTWLVTRYAAKIAPGDQVFIWRSVGGGDRDESGIIAEGVVLGAPAPREDDPASRPFWKSTTDRDGIVERARLRVMRIANKREVLKRGWMKDDPVLRDLTILKMANATNYEVSDKASNRLNALWQKTGVDWTYAESVAGLWAYHRTHGEEVSRTLGSPVSEVALCIGRTVSSVYNKVMNFRSLDPRDPRAGMSGVGQVDREVWATFYDSTTDSLRAEALEHEFQRLWKIGSPDSPTDEAEIGVANFGQEAARLTKLTLSDLMARYDAISQVKEERPRTRTERTRGYERDPLVAAIAKVRASFRCEVPGCDHPTFLSEDGSIYGEVHHIKPLSEGGSDRIDNVACLCPAHHREAHFGARAKDIFEGLIAVRAMDGHPQRGQAWQRNPGQTRSRTADTSSTHAS